MKNSSWMRATIGGAAAALVAACASIGSPEGGPRDELPPVYVRSNPMPGTTDVDRNRIEVFFNENIKLDDVQNKLVVSPAQRQSPAVNANGKRVSVELRDTLIPNTTYTFDFSDAIRDLNEGNILDGFALDFATGSTIDTLKISGMVFQARNLEPAQGMVVGVYSNLADSALTTLPMERVAKTNQFGEFTIRGLKPGTYNLFAIDDKNRDWKWDRSENIAFSTVTISPSVDAVEVADTLRSSQGTDSVVVRTAWHYLPDDVLLTWFNEDYRPQYLREYERTDQRRVTLKMGTETDSLPQITVLTGKCAGRSLADLSVIETRAGLDSIVYWLADTALIATDSLIVEARYLKTDSLEQLSLTTDTLKLYYKPPKQPKKKKNDEAADTLPPPQPLLDIKCVSSTPQELNKPLTIELPQPVAAFDTLHCRIEEAVDTLWYPTAATVVQDSVEIRRFNFSLPWKEDTRYRLVIDSLAITDIYGVWNKDYKLDFNTKRSEDYGTIIMHLLDGRQLLDSLQLSPPTSALTDSLGAKSADAADSLAQVAATSAPQIMVELLNSSDKPVMTVAADASGTATFTYVTPGTYYVRAWIDVNGNSLWDKGSIASRLQPEDVYYYPRKLNLKKNWDLDQDWTLGELPVEEQKPLDIKKNKPKNNSRSNAPKRGDADDENEDDDYNEGFDSTYGQQGSWGNGSQYNNARQGNNRPGNNRPGSNRAGMQQVRGY